MVVEKCVFRGYIINRDLCVGCVPVLLVVNRLTLQM